MIENSLPFTHLGLFEGIGGFSLAARWMGWETLAWCEWNEFGQRVLKHHFPKAEGFGDITKTDFTKYANRIDILTGGFPCQPYSVAGKRKGTEDERHLWPEMLRAIREIQPTYVVGENVRGLVSWNGGLVFEQVQADLEAEGYEVQAYVLPACAKDAPHRRDRVWFVAYSANTRSKGLRQSRENTVYGFEDATDTDGLRRTQEHELQQTELPKQFCKGGDATNPESRGQRRLRNESETTGTRKSDKPLGSVCGICDAADTCSQGLQGRKNNGGFGEIGQNGNEQFTGCVPPNWENFPTQSPICWGNDGISEGLVDITFPKWRNESIKAYGNAIVPQVAYEIFKSIYAVHHQ